MSQYGNTGLGMLVLTGGFHESLPCSIGLIVDFQEAALHQKPICLAQVACLFQDMFTKPLHNAF